MPYRRTLAEANAILAHALRKEEAGYYRELCRSDLWFLLVCGCRRVDLQHQWGVDRCDEYQANPDGYLDLWAREHYKQVDENEVVPTPYGWSRHGDLKSGDQIFGPDGRICQVVLRTTTTVPDKAYRVIFNDGVSVDVCADHRWEVERRTRKRIPMAYNRPGPKRIYRERVLMLTREIAEHDHRPDRRLAIPVSEPIQLPETALPIDPYVLGVWLGDGTASTGAITGADPQIFALVAVAGYRVGEDFRYKPPAETRTVYGLMPQLRLLCVLGNKHVPAPYLRGSIAQRLALLQGLMDTDGHCNARGTAYFVNARRELAESVHELATSLGMRACLKQRVGSYKGQPYPCWQVTFQTRADLPPFRLERKLARCKAYAGQRRHFIVGCEPIEPVPMSCIKVDRADGLYLVGRAMIPTHNTTIGLGKDLQDILINPEETIGIFAHTRPIAKAFLRVLKREMEDNLFLKGLFPDILWGNPEKEAPTWSEDSGLVVKRKGNPIEATIEAWGLVDGMPISKHFGILDLDDIVTKDNAASPEMRGKVLEAIRHAFNLGKRGGRRRIRGTPYHYSDAYRALEDEGVAIPRIHPALPIIGRSESGQRILGDEPVLLTKEQLDEKRRDLGTYVFAAQMLMDPRQDSTVGFRPEWLRTYQGGAEGLTYVIVDPANSKRKKSDYTAAVVVTCGADRNYYIRWLCRDRLGLVERINLAFWLHREFSPIAAFGYEEYGLQADIAAIEIEQTRERYRFDITPLGGTTAKFDRIQALEAIFEQRRVYLPATCFVATKDKGEMVDQVNEFVTMEYNSHPYASHDDMLDALARILDPALGVRWPRATDSYEAQKRAMNRRVHRDRVSWVA